MTETGMMFSVPVVNYKGNKYELILMAMMHAKNVKRLTNSPEPIWILIEQALDGVASGAITKEQIFEDCGKKSAPSDAPAEGAEAVPAASEAVAAAISEEEDEADEEEEGGEKAAKKPKKKKAAAKKSAKKSK